MVKCVTVIGVRHQLSLEGGHITKVSRIKDQDQDQDQQGKMCDSHSDRPPVESEDV